MGFTLFVRTAERCYQSDVLFKLHGKLAGCCMKLIEIIWLFFGVLFLNSHWPKYFRQKYANYSFSTNMHILLVDPNFLNTKTMTVNARPSILDLRVGCQFSPPSSVEASAAAACARTADNPYHGLGYRIRAFTCFQQRRWSSCIYSYTRCIYFNFNQM